MNHQDLSYQVDALLCKARSLTAETTAAETASGGMEHFTTMMSFPLSIEDWDEVMGMIIVLNRQLKQTNILAEEIAQGLAKVSTAVGVSTKEGE